MGLEQRCRRSGRLVGRGAWAQGRALEGVVVEAQGKEVIVDLGRERGLEGPAVVQVYRRVEVKHPITRKLVVDRFPIGAMLLDEVGSALSISTRWGELTQQPKVGDFVVYEPPRPLRTPEPAPAPTPTPLPLDAETTTNPALAALEETFQGTLGRPVTERIARWEAYLREHPASPHIEEVGAELTWLRDLLAQERETVAQQRRDATLHAAASIPRAVGVDEPLELVIAVTEPERVEAMRVLWRRRGEVAYQTTAMTPAGALYWRANLPADAPGALEGFIEAVRSDGRLEAVAGAAAAPHTITVEDRARTPEHTWGRSRATLLAELVDFKSGDLDDHYLRLESEFRYTTGLELLHAVRVGAGIFNGAGASLRTLERGGPSRELDVLYGTLAGDLAFGRYVGLGTTLLLGNLGGEEGRALTDTAGLRLELRLGDADGTQLVLGAAATQGIGNEAWITFRLDAIERVPMEASVVVTNLPVGEDAGVSLNYGAGWEVTGWLALMARVGWNARTINHFGPTLGAGAVLTW